MAQETRKSYSSVFLKIVESKLVTLGENEAGNAGAVFFNTNWEGDITSPGATAVNVPVEGDDPTVRDYDKANGITNEVIDGDNLLIPITTDKALNELLDGYDVNTIPAKVVSRRLIRAAKAFAKFIDTDGIAVLEGEGTPANGAVITKDNAYSEFLEGTKAGMEASVSFAAAIVTPTFYTAIKQSDNFVVASEAGFNMRKTGVVGVVDGVAIVVSNKLSTLTDFVLVDSDHATRIIAWKVAPKLVSLDGSTKYIGASAIKGRLVVKHKVTNSIGVYVRSHTV